MKLLVIGNGSTGVDIASQKSFINNHTGHFLNKVNDKVEVGFSQFTTVYNHNSNLQNYDITATNISNHNLPNKKHPLFLFNLIRLLSQYDYIYIFYPGSLGTLVGILARLLNKPYGLYVRGEYYNRNRFDKIVLDKSEFILTISPAFVPSLKKFCKTVDVIKPMISIKPKDLNKHRTYKTPKKWNLLFVGRVEERKGIKELLQIASILKGMDFYFCLSIIGGGDLFAKTTDQIKELHLENEVTLHGLISNKDQLSAFYNAANAFIFTSHDEGFPRVLYEAMASGLPIFTTFVGGISGRMKDRDNCVEIPVKNSEKAAEIIIDFLRKESFLEEIGRNGQKTLEKIIDGSVLTHEELLFKYL